MTTVAMTHAMLVIFDTIEKSQFFKIFNYPFPALETVKP